LVLQAALSESVHTGRLFGRESSAKPVRHSIVQGILLRKFGIRVIGVGEEMSSQRIAVCDVSEGIAELILVTAVKFDSPGAYNAKSNASCHESEKRFGNGVSRSEVT
jgi:hypothetical protein